MITDLDIKTVSFLINYAKLNKIYNKFTLASCLVFNNKKYGLSVNDYYSDNPLTKKYKYPNKVVHSETATIYKASKLLNISKFRQSSLIVVGLGKSNSCNYLKSSKPCKYCYDIIINFNIKRLVYVISKDNKQLTINEELLDERNKW